MEYMLNLNEKDKNELDPVVFEALNKNNKKKKRTKTKKKNKKKELEDTSEKSSNNNSVKNKFLNRRRSGILITNEDLNKARMSLIDKDLSKLIKDELKDK